MAALIFRGVGLPLVLSSSIESSADIHAGGPASAKRSTITWDLMKEQRWGAQMREMYFSFLRAIPQEVLKFLSAPPKEDLEYSLGKRPRGCQSFITLKYIPERVSRFLGNFSASRLDSAR